MKKIWNVPLVCVAFALVLTGCTNLIGSGPQTPQANPPQAGKATVTGVVVSSQNNQPLTETVVRLAEVQRQGGTGAYILDDGQSPGTTTNEQGQFMFENVEAKEYVIVIGDVGSGRYAVIADSSGKPRVWNATAENVLEVGTLAVDLDKPSQ